MTQQQLNDNLNGHAACTYAATIHASRAGLAARGIGILAVVVCVLATQTVPLVAQTSHRGGIDIEGAAVWQHRNDIRIPNNATATEFSVVDAIGTGPYGAFRLAAEVDLNERHGLRFVAAPLVIEGTGQLLEDVSFAGKGFAPGSVDATYKFSSYRATYRYRAFDGDRWTWRLGFTGFIRDARVALKREGQLAEDTDVGFVPLLYLQGTRKSPHAGASCSLG